MMHFTGTRRRTDDWFCSRVTIIQSQLYYILHLLDALALDIHIYIFFFPSFFRLRSFLLRSLLLLYYYFLSLRILIRHGLGEHRLRKRIKALIRWIIIDSLEPSDRLAGRFLLFKLSFYDMVGSTCTCYVYRVPSVQTCSYRGRCQYEEIRLFPSILRSRLREATYARVLRTIKERDGLIKIVHRMWNWEEGRVHKIIRRKQGYVWFLVR